MSEDEAKLHGGEGPAPIVVGEPLTIEQVRDALAEGARERAAAERVACGRRIVRRR